MEVHKMDHDYKIEGKINNGYVEGTGIGKIGKDGVSELDVNFSSLPQGWDPRTIALICCGRALFMGSREEDGAINMYTASGGLVTIGKGLPMVNRRGVIRDAQGNLFADIQASSETNLRGRGYDHSKIEGGYSKIEPGKNGIAAVDPFSGVMMQAGPGVVNILTNYEITTEDGQTLYGFTFYPHALPAQQKELPFMQSLDVVSVEQELKGKKLHVRTVSRVAPVQVGSLDALLV